MSDYAAFNLASEQLHLANHRISESTHVQDERSENDDNVDNGTEDREGTDTLDPKNYCCNVKSSALVLAMLLSVAHIIC
jgi:hypothetical protein